MGGGMGNTGLTDDMVDGARIAPMGSVREEMDPHMHMRR